MRKYERGVIYGRRNVGKGIDGWKKPLDMGKRNRLLNYKDTKRSNIRIIDPDLEELYKKACS